jgi:hypothetical protein
MEANSRTNMPVSSPDDEDDKEPYQEVNRMLQTSVDKREAEIAVQILDEKDNAEQQEESEPRFPPPQVMPSHRYDAFFLTVRDQVIPALNMSKDIVRGFRQSKSYFKCSLG